MRGAGSWHLPGHRSRRWRPRQRTGAARAADAHVPRASAVPAFAGCEFSPLPSAYAYRMLRACPTPLALLIPFAVALFACGGCGGGRPYGDPDGQPVSFTVDISREFVRDISHQGLD